MRMERPPVEIAAALCDGIQRIARHIQEKVTAYPAEYADQFKWRNASRVLTAVGKLRLAGCDFSVAVQAMLDALNAGHPPSSPYGREILEGWLRGAREGAAA